MVKESDSVPERTAMPVFGCERSCFPAYDPSSESSISNGDFGYCGHQFIAVFAWCNR